MDKTCKACRYCRNVEHNERTSMRASVHNFYCSNFKSPLFRYVNNVETFITPAMTCPEFTPRDKKVPAWLRLANYLLSPSWWIVFDIIMILFYLAIFVAFLVVLHG